MKNSGFTLRKRLESFRYAFNGLRLLFKQEHNTWIHGFVAICVILAGVFLKISSMEWIVIVIVIGLVLAAEAINSSIEVLADHVCSDYSDNIKRVKDLAAGAVLLTAIAAAVVGLIIFIPKLVPLFS